LGVASQHPPGLNSEEYHYALSKTVPPMIQSWPLRTWINTNLALGVVLTLEQACLAEYHEAYYAMCFSNKDAAVKLSPI
jgi:hypothetical protein